MREIKRFWQKRGVWSATEPIDRYGPAVTRLDDPVYAMTGRDIRSREALEDAIVVDYGETALAYRNEPERVNTE